MPHPAPSVDVVDLTLVIPAYNEELRLLPTLERLHAHLSAQPMRYEIVVVDDGSRDRHVRGRRGGGGADPEHRPRAPAAQPRQGRRRPPRHARRARADPRDVGRRLLDAARGAAAPARADRGRARRRSRSARATPKGAKTVKQPLYRVLWSRLCNKVIQRWLVPRVRDTQCGFKAFTAARGAQPVRQRDDRRLGVRSRDPRARPPPRLRDRRGRRRVEGRRALARQSAQGLLEGDPRGADDPPQPRPRRLRDDAFRGAGEDRDLRSVQRMSIDDQLRLPPNGCAPERVRSRVAQPSHQLMITPEHDAGG